MSADITSRLVIGFALSTDEVNQIYAHALQEVDEVEDEFGFCNITKTINKYLSEHDLELLSLQVSYDKNLYFLHYNFLDEHIGESGCFKDFSSQIKFWNHEFEIWQSIANAELNQFLSEGKKIIITTFP